MRIKRFLAPDMRTALRMIRDEQGPDAVILSNRATDEGIEVVAATDYDEALVSQALRAAAPGLEPLATREAVERPVVAANATTSATHAAATAAQPAPADMATAPATAPDIAFAPAPGFVAAAAVRSQATLPRESLIARARAVLRIGDNSAGDEGPTLAELAASPPDAPAPASRAAAETAATASAARSRANPDATAPHVPAAPSRFEAMMAALTRPLPGDGATTGPAVPPACANPVGEPGEHDRTATDPAGMRDRDAAPARSVADAPSSSAPRLRAVADEPAPDPAIAAMREEMARMRALMEAQMAQLSLERLRGAPGRAAAFDALIGLGCEEAIAQAVAARLDPRLPPCGIREPMLAELAGMLPVVHGEPLDEGGVIALVGPTGAGKTTTAAKLAARFAARYRTRDVAMVTTDARRAGAREQLHAHGLRLGVTVCEATGPEGLRDALAQLADYPLVLVDTTGHAAHEPELRRQLLWLRAAQVRSLLVLPANAHPHDLGEAIARYRNAAPAGVVLTKLDETGRPGSALSVLARHGLGIAYATRGQAVPEDIEAADAARLVRTLHDAARPAIDNRFAPEDLHVAV